MVNSAFYKEVLQHLKRLSNRKDWRNGRMVGCSIMTMGPATCHSPSDSVWWVKIFVCYRNQPTLLTCYCVTSGCPPESVKLKEKQFDRIEDIFNMTCHLVIFPKEDFQKYFQHWQECWNYVCVCVCAREKYFEGD
jgi:hypothetical protein